MTYTTFQSKETFLSEVQEANEKMKNLLGKIKIALSEQGYPLRKDTYHFLTRVLKPEGRVERTLYMLLFQVAYQSEILSAGSSYLAIRFANEFIEELLKSAAALSGNEVALINEFERLAEVYKARVCSGSIQITEKTMQEEISRICEDEVLAAAIWEALAVSGLEGKIHVEDGQLANYVVEQKSGYYFQVLKPFKFMLPPSGFWEAQNPKVMLVDGILEKVSELDKIMTGALETKIPVLLIAQGFSEEVIATIKTNVDHGKFDIMPVRLPVDLESLNVMNDLAVVSGCDVVSILKGQMVCFTEFGSLETVERVRLTMRELSIENAKTRRGVSQHLRMLLEKRLSQHDVSDISDLIDKRIQGLISAAVVLRLPNMTATKRDNVKVKVDVALRNAKTLLNYGQTALGTIASNPSEHGSLERAFWNALSRVQEEIPVAPALSAFSGIYFAGKTILSMMTTGGLVKIET